MCVCMLLHLYVHVHVHLIKSIKNTPLLLEISMQLVLQSNNNSPPYRMDSSAHYFEYIQKTYEGKVVVDIKVCM